ncbi:MinD/ParA family protein [Paenibacillus sp. 481]|uniref:MinD/ParA family protein n=1 Tax=Paenibacillus sp. 481 TaxID=2835869 RepID=UPI001E41C9E4|nr:MinD/ParA family protein [Paenibacillus sp. 481]UHA73919.1 MinD/ParA family protein [Paenibacillus sp. 481]
MMDQAQALRRLVARKSVEPNEADNRKSTTAGARVITVTSGKGGVGKSNFSINFALALQECGLRTLVFDADIGMANIDVLLGSRATVHLVHVMQQRKSLQDIIQIGPRGLHYIPGGSGFTDLLDLPTEQLESFLQQMEALADRYDVILFDTGAGLSKETIRFISAADETFVVTTPEPPSIADAYALIKVVSGMFSDTQFRLVINRAMDWNEGQQTANKLQSVAQQFLKIELPTLGYLFDDPLVMQAVKKQMPFSLLYPDSIVSKQIRQLAQVYVKGQQQTDHNHNGGVKQFLHKWLRRWSN